MTVKIDKELYKFYHTNGHSVLSISKIMDVKYQTLCGWARRNGFVSNPVMFARACSRMYDKGATDREIADDTQHDIVNVVMWRRRRHLPANGQLRLLDIYSKMQELYARGYTDEQIAKFLGKKRYNVEYWRRKRGLESNRNW